MMAYSMSICSSVYLPFRKRVRAAWPSSCRPLVANHRGDCGCISHDCGDDKAAHTSGRNQIKEATMLGTTRNRPKGICQDAFELMVLVPRQIRFMSNEPNYTIVSDRGL